MQWYEEVIQTLLIGITNGAIISLVALGYTLVYGIIELINFAHGDVFMIGSMISLTLLTWVPGLLGQRRGVALPGGGGIPPVFVGPALGVGGRAPPQCHDRRPGLPP